MKSDAKIIDHLNRVLANELVAINQFFLHSRMLKNWGLNKAGQKEYEESMEELKHADILMDRILFLEGVPKMELRQFKFGRNNIKDVIAADLEVEMTAIGTLKEAIGYMEGVRDYVSRDLLRAILADEEHHVDYLETQVELVERLGLPIYEQSQM